ncbi:MAG TPA: cupin domain-containing protein [Stellaceae bacterium]|jgi:hypothetical protein|nr:cupin domain-containing protein [Stellaceae bacterium]
MTDLIRATRRDLLLAPLLATLPLALGGESTAAAVDPAMTIIKLPPELTWTKNEGFPEKSVEAAPLWGKTGDPGLYYVLIRWYPGYMSAPHWYETDRYSLVVSGTWWVGSGDKFDLESTVPAPAGSLVRRIARTPHYDGVKAGATEPAVIAICGMGPITFHNTDPATPGWRKV